MIEKARGFLEEFKTFALRGNVIDLAIGVVIGTAFGKIVDSFVKDILMPPFSILIGKADFTNLYWILKDAPNSLAPYASLEAAKAAGAITLNYGLFINALISFTIIVFSIFLAIKLLNKLKDVAVKKEEAQIVEVTKKCPYCMSTIDINATKCAFCTSDL